MGKTEILDSEWELLNDPCAFYWFTEFARKGMCSPQAEVLATTPSLDRHAVRDVIEAGCDPDTAFLIFS